MKAIGGVILFLIPLVISAAPQPMNYFMCRNGKFVRTIRSEMNKKLGECQTVYTKAGLDKIVASGNNPMHCRVVGEKIRDNLEGTKFWRCRDIGKAQVHNRINN